MNVTTVGAGGESYAWLYSAWWRTGGSHLPSTPQRPYVRAEIQVGAAALHGCREGCEVSFFPVWRETILLLWFGRAILGSHFTSGAGGWARLRVGRPCPQG